MVARTISLLYREIKGLHQAAYVLALFTLASQILAIVRDRTLAHQFGAGYELDIYYAAFRVPDLLFVLFASVLSVYVLLPFVSRALSTEQGQALLSQVFTLFLVCYSVLSGLILLYAPVLVPLLFPGFSSEAQQEVVLLLRLLLLQPLFLGISSLCGVITQLQHRFVIYALSPLLYNLGIIIGVIVLYDWFGLAGLAYGVVIGALGHMLIQLPLIIKSDLRFSLTFQFDWKLLRQVAHVAIPRALTLSLHQVQFLVFVMLASVMAIGSVSVFQFAYNLQSVPLAIIGVSYSVAAFPTLTDLLSKQKQSEFNRYILTALRHIIFWSVPIIALVIVLRAQIVRVLLGSGSFDWDDTRLTAAVLGLFVVTLTLQAIVLLQVRALYAGGRTLLPFGIALFGTTTAIGTSFASYYYIINHTTLEVFLADILRLTDVVGVEVLALPFGFTAGVFVEAVCLLLVTGKIYRLSYRPLVRSTVIAITAAIVGGLVAYASLLFVVEGVNQNTFVGIFLQGIVGAVSGVVAIVVTYALLRSRELEEMYQSFRARIFKTDVVAPQPDVL